MIFIFSTNHMIYKQICQNIPLFFFLTVSNSRNLLPYTYHVNGDFDLGFEIVEKQDKYPLEFCKYILPMMSMYS